MPDSIITLDLGSRTGWCWWRRGEPLRYGSFLVAPSGVGVGAYMSKADQRLHAFFAAKPADAYVIEYLGQFRNSTATLMKTWGLQAAARKVLFERGVYQVDEAKPDDVRVHCLGRGRRTREQKKAATREFCRQIGFPTKNDDEADAIATLHWYAHAKGIDIGLPTGPLFGEHAA